MRTIIADYTDILDRHHTLCIPLGLFFAWLLYFPMGQGLGTMGQILNIPSDLLLRIFLPSHALGLVLCGLMWTKIPRIKEFTPVSLVALIFFCLSIMYLPQHWLPYATMLAGVAAAPYTIGWVIRFVAETKPGERCKTMALTMALSNLLVMLLTATSPLSSLKWLALWGCTPILLLLMYSLRHSPTPNHTPMDAGDLDKNANTAPGHYLLGAQNILLFTMLLIAFYLTSGYLYGEMYKEHAPLGGFIFSYSFLPSVIGALMAGYWGDLYERKLIAHIGLAFLGVSLVIFPVSSGLWGFLISQTLIQIAYSFIDVFLWTTLAAMAMHFAAEKTFGLGLGLNVMIIFVGIKLNNIFAMYGFQTLMPIFLLVIIFMGLAFLYGYTDVNEENEEEGGGNLPEDNYNRQLLDMLTPREREVAGLILKGKSNKDMAIDLNVSENTVKTHIRNILQKTDVPNKLKFISKYNQYL